MKLYILLPSYNEGQALPLLLKSIYEVVRDRYEDYEVVVINDGSLDNTEEAAMLWEGLLNIKVITHEENRGLGAAVNTGLHYFYEYCDDDDAAVIMDADNTHNPMLIPEMLACRGPGADVVIASRYADGGREVGLGFFRKLCSFCASMLLNFFFNIPDVKDYTCGYRLYSGSIIKKAYDTYGDNFIMENGFTCMAEILVKLNYIGCDFAEVPLELRYDLKEGNSKMKVAKTIKRYFVMLFNLKRHIRGLASQPAFIEGKEK